MKKIKIDGVGDSRGCNWIALLNPIEINVYPANHTGTIEFPYLNENEITIETCQNIYEQKFTVLFFGTNLVPRSNTLKQPDKSTAAGFFAPTIGRVPNMPDRVMESRTDSDWSAKIDRRWSGGFIECNGGASARDFFKFIVDKIGKK